MPYLLSVDLGTTFSAAATNEAGQVEIFPLGSRAAVIPSVVALRPDGTVLTGEAAERREVSEPTRVAREFKRRLGDPTPLVIGGTPYGAEALMAELLRAIVDQVSQQKVAAPDRVVLSHPANYGPYKLDLLAQVGHLAEIADVEFIREPEAAARHYLELDRIEQGEVVAVYDLGGGTFDVALVRRTSDGFGPLGTPDGMERFGGIDLDEAVFDHVRRSLGDAMDGLDPHDAAATSALVRLREDCRRAKEALSSDSDVAIPVMLPNVHTEVRLTRAEFEDLIRPRLRETMRMLERVIRSGGLEFGDLSQVLLVGGSSRIPLVAEMVGETTGRPVALGAHPKHAIALGAATVRSGAPELSEEVITEAATEAAPTETAAPAPAPPAEPAEPEAGPAAPAGTPEPPPAAPSGAEPEPKPRTEPAQPAAVSEPAASVVDSPEPGAAPASPRPRRGRIYGLAAVLLLAVAVVVGAVIVSGGGTDATTVPPDQAGTEGGGAEPEERPPDEGAPLIDQMVVPIRIAITGGDGALVLAGGASWEPVGPLEVSGPDVDAAVGPDAILIAKRADDAAGPLAEAMFEVTFRDVEEAVHFVIERSNPDTVLEVVFVANPAQRAIVAQGDLNPAEFVVARHDMSG